MKIALNWLGQYCRLPWDLDALVQQLTMSGTEVESVTRTGIESNDVVTAKIVSFVQHPNADRLSVCQVEDGKGTRQVVCGAKNFKAGDVVFCALPGASLPNGLKIKSSKLRGELSEGMLCSADELGLGDGAHGLLILDPATPLGKPVHDVVKSETVIEVEVTPNRADLLSYLGMARELSALGAELLPYKIADVPPTKAPAFRAAVADAKWCPRYTLQEIEGVSVGASPDWLKQKLESAGLRSLNNVVDITNFVLLETGQPLHAFDADKLKGDILEVRLAKEGEEFLALNGKTYKLDEGDLVIADAGGPVALAGVMGGERSAVTESTKRVVLESASFLPGTVRRTSRRLALISDSSYRFERGMDPALVDLGRRRAVQLFGELASATAVSGVFETAPAPAPANEVTLRHERLEALLGIKVEKSRVISILTRLGLREKSDGLWLVPGFRPDLTREVDLIEEIARIEGLDRVPSRLQFYPAATSAADKAHEFEKEVKARLAGWGYQEMITGSLLPRAEATGEAVTLLNPLNEDYAVLRPSLLASALPSIAKNLSHGISAFKGFEIGTVYSVHDGKESEEKRLLLVLSGNERESHWTEPARTADFYSLKGILEGLQGMVPHWKMDPEPATLSVELRKRHGIKQPVFYVEAALPAAEGKTRRYKEVSPFPPVTRDVALVVDRGVKQADVRRAILSANIQELERVEFFDQFIDDSGTKLGADKKSLAYALTYRSHGRTLEEKEVNAWQQRILDQVSAKVGAVLR